MKRLFTAFLCFAFLMTISFDVYAVEKKQKKEPAKKTEQKKPVKPKPAPAPAVQPAPKPPKKDVKAEKKYDNFIDKNKNGIDDRRENLKKKSVKPISNPKPKKSTAKKNQ